MLRFLHQQSLYNSLTYCNADRPFHTTGLSQKPSVHFLICACHLDTCAADIGRGPNGLQSVIVLIIWKVLSKQLRDKSHRNIQERRRAEKNTHHLYIYIYIYKLSHLSLIGGLWLGLPSWNIKRWVVLRSTHCWPASVSSCCGSSGPTVTQELAMNVLQCQCTVWGPFTKSLSWWTIPITIWSMNVYDTYNIL